MKNLLFPLLAVAFLGCKDASDSLLQKKVDSLQSVVNHSYKPGLGEFMSEIQVHHAKLWFAGKYENWALAGFEVGEIREALEDIPEFCSDRPEVKSIGIIEPAMDSLTVAIREKNERKFSSGFTLLTTSCNDCHKATNHGFNLIKIPDLPPVTNQVFKHP